MTIGLRIRNASNVVQIDDTYQNMALRQKGVTTSATTGGTQNGYYKATLTIPLTGIIAFRCSANCMIDSIVTSGSTRLVTFLTRGPGVAVNYYLFDTADQGLTSYGTSYGLRVRTPGGLVAFDSRMKYMRVLESINGGGSSVDPVNSPGLTRNYASGTQPAIVQGMLRNWATVAAISGSNPPMTLYLWNCTVATTGIGTLSLVEDTINSQQFSQSNVVAYNFSQYYYSYLVIDVAGI